jgi:hypothetical protein
VEGGEDRGCSAPLGVQYGVIAFAGGSIRTPPPRRRSATPAFLPANIVCRHGLHSSARLVLELPYSSYLLIAPDAPLL